MTGVAAGEDARCPASMALRRSPKPGALTAQHLEDAAQLVDHERRQGLALDVLGDDQQRAAALGDLLEQREQVLDRRDLLLVDQDVGVLELARPCPRGLVTKCGREVALVELHALDPLDLGLEALALFDGDDAVLADPVHRLGDHLADLRVVVGGDRADLGDLLAALDRRRHLARAPRRPRRRPSSMPRLMRDRARAGGDVLEAFLEDRLGEHGRGGGAVAGDVGGLGGDLLAPSGRPCSRRGPRARSPWRR